MSSRDRKKQYGFTRNLLWFLPFLISAAIIFGLPLLVIGLVVPLLILPVFLYRAYTKVHFDYNEVSAALSNIDVHLRKRYDTLPNLFKSVMHAMAHEKNLLKEIVELRNHAPSLSKTVNSDDLNQTLCELTEVDKKLKNFMLTMENYPELRSIESINRAMIQLERVEADIAASRSIYNGCVHANNTNSDTWPYSMFFDISGMDRKPYYQDPEPEKINQSFDVDTYLAS